VSGAAVAKLSPALYSTIAAAAAAAAIESEHAVSLELRTESGGVCGQMRTTP